MTFTFALGRDAFDYWMLGGNLLLAVVGIVGIVVAVMNVQQARMSAEAARTAAEAALKSITVDLEVKRPRITVKAEGAKIVTFTMINKGGSQAQIIQFNNIPRWKFPLVGEQMGEPSLGDVYENEDLQIMNIPSIHPGEKMEAGAFYLRAIEEGNPAVFEEIKSGKRLLYLYSGIKYKGPFSDQRFETRYCFRITQHGPMMAGDIGYNFET